VILKVVQGVDLFRHIEMAEGEPPTSASSRSVPSTSSPPRSLARVRAGPASGVRSTPTSSSRGRGEAVK
jgi:hypothetical protein